jgi:hypothetical protein
VIYPHDEEKVVNVIINHYEGNFGIGMIHNNCRIFCKFKTIRKVSGVIFLELHY